MATRPGMGTAGIVLAAIVCIALLGICGLALLPHRPAAPASPSAGQLPQQAEMERLRQRMLRSSDLPQVSNPGSIDPDSTDARARRELQRLRREAGMAEPAADASGNVHLGTGATMSAEEWRRTQRALSR